MHNHQNLRWGDYHCVEGLVVSHSISSLPLHPLFLICLNCYFFKAIKYIKKQNTEEDLQNLLNKITTKIQIFTQI